MQVDFASAKIELPVLTVALLGMSKWMLKLWPLLLAGLAVLAGASALGAASSSLMLLLATRVAEGLGLMLVVIAAPALITRLSAPHDRPLAFALWGCFMPFGMAVVMLAAPALSAIGWRGLWLGMSGLLLLILALAWRFLPQPPPLPRTVRATRQRRCSPSSGT